MRKPIELRQHVRANRREILSVISACMALATIVLAIPGVVGLATAQESAEAPRTVRVGVYVSPPFVMEKAGGYTGMAIELWEAISRPLNLRSDYVLLSSFQALVDAAAANEIDAAVTNLTITRSRALKVDFTQPWFDAGLRIMIDEERRTSFGDVVRGLADSGHLRAYAWLVAVIVAATILLTFFDRRFDKDFPRRWRDGVADSFYSVMSIATSGRSPARKNLFGWAGRLWQGLWLACGVAVLAYVTSTVTSVMTTLSITSEINSVADLPGKRVGVLGESLAQDFVEEEALERRAYGTLDAIVEGLLRGDIDAIIGDAPVLEYYEHTHPEHPLKVTGAIFEPDKYGFGFALDSQLARDVTLELLRAHESDMVQELDEKYFGEEE
ncbi:MAG: transporter substrate-binding domain-containing protein [Rhizobiaceae bacterium]